METWVAEMCRKRARRQTLAWTLTFLAGIIFACLNIRYVKNFLAGPYPLQPDALAQITDADTTPVYFVSVAGEKAVDTGIQEVETTTNNGVKEGSRVTAGYYALLLGDHFLIVKSPNQPPNSISGELKPFPPDLSGQLFSGADGQQLQTRSYPFFLDSEGFRYPGYWGIGIAWLFVGLFWKFGKPASIRWRDVTKHPVVKRLEQWGDPNGVSADIQSELANSVLDKSGAIILTNKYLVHQSFFSFNILRFDDLLWAYKKVTQKSTYFIPTGKTFEGILTFYGGRETFSGNEHEVDKALSLARNRAPWAIIGYSEEINKLFNSRTSEFCEAVESRRQELAKKVK